MFTKLKVKKYLKTKEVFSLFDEVLSFYTTVYMKEVFRFWGLQQISIQVEWENELPIQLNVFSIYDNTMFNWSFNEIKCTYKISNESMSFDMNFFTTIHELFDFMRNQLSEKTM